MHDLIGGLVHFDYKYGIDTQIVNANIFPITGDRYNTTQIAIAFGFRSGHTKHLYKARRYNNQQKWRFKKSVEREVLQKEEKRLKREIRKRFFRMERARKDFDTELKEFVEKKNAEALIIQK